MQIARASWKELQTRIDPQFYHPQHIADLLSLNRFATARLDDLRLQDTKMSYGVLKPRFTESQFRLARIQNFADPFLESDDCEGIEEDQFFEYLRSECRQGDILIAIGGYVGRAVITPSIPFRLNINQHIARFRPGKDVSVDPYFLVTYLISSIGRRHISRYVSGSVQVGINLEDLREIKIPKPHIAGQTYIGDKVRQAERQRMQARELERQFEAVIRESYPAIFGPIVERGRHSRATPMDLNATLNPGAYNPERLRIRKVIKELGGCELHELSDAITPISSNYLPRDVYIGLEAISSTSSALSSSTMAESEVQGAVRVLREGPVISKLRPYLNKVAYIPSALAGAFGSTELLCLRPKDEVSGWFLYGVLKLESTIRQLNPIATGATHPRVTREDVLELAVPQIANEKEIGQWLTCAQESYFTSERLTITAKLLVEALIEGKLSEVEMKEAQESLEHGEREADRVILARLTRKGIDVTGEPPLFPDLDALYGALDQTATSHEQAAD